MGMAFDKVLLSLLFLWALDVNDVVFIAVTGAPGKANFFPEFTAES